MNIQQNMSLMEKLSILTAAAKYDVACTSSGVDRRGNGTRHGELSRLRNLSLILCGWALYFSAQDPLYQ